MTASVELQTVYHGLYRKQVIVVYLKWNLQRQRFCGFLAIHFEGVFCMASIAVENAILESARAGNSLAV
jgi:hypothetical protein